MAKGIKRKIDRAVDNLTERVGRSTNRDSVFARGMAWEGYAGGYRDALHDVLALLNGLPPGSAYSDLWEEKNERG